MPGITGRTAPRSGSGSVRKGIASSLTLGARTCSKAPGLATRCPRMPGSAKAGTAREDAMAQGNKKGLLFASFDFSTAHADEFHDWYDLEHIPERQGVPGFGACERWISDEQPTVSV